MHFIQTELCTISHTAPTTKHTGPIYVKTIEHSLRIFNIQGRKKSAAIVTVGVMCLASIRTAAKWPGCVYAAAPAMTPVPLAGELEMTPYPQAEKMGWHSVPSGPQHLTLPHFFKRDLTFLTALQVCQNRHQQP